MYRATGVRFFSSASKYDVVVVGGGPGGYVCAIKAAQLGLRTACVDKRGSLGGTCLNVGCIPSKALLHISHQYHDAAHSFKKNGIIVDGPIKVDLASMMKQKTKTVRTLTKGIAGLFKSNGVDYFEASANFLSPNTIEVTNKSDGAKQTIETANVVVAVGSEPSGLPGFPKELVDETDIVSSTGALDFKEVPENLCVVGGGVIGLELGSVWARLGAKVHVVEFLGKIMGPADMEVSKTFQKVLQKQGITFDLNSKVVAVDKKGGKINLKWEAANDQGKPGEMIADKVLIATGRAPNTQNCSIENLGVNLDKMGRIEVDSMLKAGNGIYAIGDCISGPMLAHKAEEDGVYVAEQIAGHAVAPAIDYKAVPSVVYTHPEVAWVGKSEEELTAEGTKFTKASFPMMANSRARANDETAGFVKLLVSDDADKKILGCHIICPGAGDVLMPAVMSVTHDRSVLELAHGCFAHPTVSEALKEAAMAAAFGKPIHM